MAMTYTNLVKNVRDWSNRDEAALPDPIIRQCLRWSADTAYRELQTPPLEYTQEYVLLNTDVDPESVTTLLPENAQQVNIESSGGLTGFTSANLPIPGDLTSFIQIRVIGVSKRDPDQPSGPDDPTVFLKLGNGCLDIDFAGIRSGIVFNEKTDIRTFYDHSAVKVSEFFWSRQQNDIVIAGRLQAGDVIEVLYYRRLAALDARYMLNQNDFDAAFAPEMGGFVDTTPYSADGLAKFIEDDTEPSISADDFFQPNPDADPAVYYLGIHTDHWLRDQNERILIFGALWQIFDYLGDDAMGAKYAQKYQLEMQEINKEELRRTASGGNTQVHYNSILI